MLLICNMKTIVYHTTMAIASEGKDLMISCFVDFHVLEARTG